METLNTESASHLLLLAGKDLKKKKKATFWCTLTSVSAGEATVIMMWPCAMPSQEAAFLVTEMEMAR